MLQVWDMLTLDSLNDKYLRPASLRDVKRLFAKLVLATAAGEVGFNDLAQLAARASKGG